MANSYKSFVLYLGAELKAIQENNPQLKYAIGGEWLLKNQRLISFINLGEHPWEQVCEVGTLERFNTREWAYSDNPDKQRDFVRLMNRCLRALTRTKNLQYSRDLDIYYVRAKKDLLGKDVEIKYYYRSAQKMTSRKVFLGYKWNEEKQRYLYFRHSAFKGRFVRHDDTWYLEITPTYHFTWNGHDLDAFDYQASQLPSLLEVSRRPEDRKSVV